MTDREHRFELAEPFTATERGRYEAVHRDGAWQIEPASSEWGGFPLEPGATVAGVVVNTRRLEVTRTGQPDGRLILDLPMREGNEAYAATIRDYLISLLRVAMDIKSPWGNSGWEYDLYKALADGGFVAAERDENGYIEWRNFDKIAATGLIETAIGALGG